MSTPPPMRIALMVEDFPVISETFVINIAAGLLEHGHDVTVLAMSGQKPSDGAMHRTVERWNMESLVRRPRAGRLLIGGFERDTEGAVPSQWGLARRTAAFAAQAAMLATQPRFDVVHCQFAHLGLAAMRHRRMGTLRTDHLVVHVRGQDVTSFVRAHGEDVYRELFDTADLVVANCRHFRDRAIELGAPRGSVEVIGSAVDCTRFTPREGVDPEPASTDLLRLVAVGRLVPKKGFDTAIRAIAEVADDLPGIVLDIIGEGPMRSELEALAHDLGVGDAVTLVGALPHEAIVERFADADLLLAPSVTPASGDQDAPVNSLKEAMAMELPVIATRHGGIPELVEEGVTGYLAPEADPIGLADAVRRAVSDRDRWGTIGGIGRQRILEEYDLPVVTSKLIAAYRSLTTPGAAER
ncbi:MAG: glycosyltransferase [Ilumatobacter sp.]|uniref:glycosyltransferase n=1 Tax=Ilumatobacter sp. TaxID=1967498 RepID=UPI003C71A624